MNATHVFTANPTDAPEKLPAWVTQVIFALLLCFVSLGMGSTIATKDLRTAVKSRGAVLIGWGCQFGFMPLICFLLSKAQDFDADVAVGFILVGCSPGGTLSNLFTYFAQGHLALSITMTAASTLCSSFMFPLLVFIYISSSEYGDSHNGITVPFLDVFLSLCLVVIPAGFGVYLKYRCERIARVTEKMGLVTGLLFIVIALVGGSILYFDDFFVDPVVKYDVLVVVALMQPLGFVFGYGTARIFRQPARFCRTICLETALQNTSITITLITFAFADLPERQRLRILAPALWGSICAYVHCVWMVLLLRWLATRDPTSLLYCKGVMHRVTRDESDKHELQMDVGVGVGVEVEERGEAGSTCTPSGDAVPVSVSVLHQESFSSASHSSSVSRSQSIHQVELESIE